MKTKAIFIHAAILPRCKERLIQYLDVIYKNRLMEVIDNIFICFIGEDAIPINDNDLLIYNSNKIKLVKLSNNLQEYELPTLHFLCDFCKNNKDSDVLYLHTKNVGKEINLCIEDQIDYMLYFNVVKWQECLNALREYDTCGVDLREDPTLHYSGNFWWSTASNINSLPTIIEFNNIEQFPNPLNSLRHNQEFWICYNKNNKHLSLWDCGINCYERHLHRYSKELYFNF